MNAWSAGTLFKESQDVMDEIGQGMILAQHRVNDGLFVMFKRGPWNPPFENHLVDINVGRELLSSGLLSELTEHRNNQKVGWRELDLPGEEFKFYLMIQ